MIDIKSYQEGFMDGVGCKDNYKIHLLGYDLTELLKIVDDYAIRKHEMQVSTKQEIFNTYGLTLEDLVEAQNRKYSPMPTKAKMTRAEAVNLLGLHCLSPKTDVEAMISFYIAAGMLEIVEEKRKPIEWGEPLHLITSHGTYKAKYIGKDSKGRRVVDIEDYTKSQDYCTYCNPNDDGYIIEYDRWLENY